MSTFQEKVEDYIGSVSNTDALSDWLTEGARIVGERFRPDRLAIYATDKTDSGSGIALTGGRPLSAHKSGYEARLVPKGMSASIVDGDSIHYAVNTDPAWYIDLEKGYVLPGGGTIKWFGYPSVLYSADTIGNYPPQGFPAIILYVAIQGQISNISTLVKTTLGGLTFSFPTVVTNVSAPSFTFTPPTFGGSHTDLDTVLDTDQDTELALAYNSQIQSYLQEYSSDIQKALAVYREAVDEYTATSGKFDRDLQNYVTQVTKEVQRIQTLIQQYSSMSQSYFPLLKELREEFNRSLETL